MESPPASLFESFQEDIETLEASRGLSKKHVDFLKISTATLCDGKSKFQSSICKEQDTHMLLYLAILCAVNLPSTSLCFFVPRHEDYAQLIEVAYDIFKNVFWVPCQPLSSSIVIPFGENDTRTLKFFDSSADQPRISGDIMFVNNAHTVTDEFVTQILFPSISKSTYVYMTSRGSVSQFLERLSQQPTKFNIVTKSKE